MQNKKPPLNFNPAAALILNPEKFELTITVDMTTGGMVMKSEGPELNFLAVCDILNTQIQVILRQAIMATMEGRPGFVPPGDFDFPGRSADRNTDRNTEGIKTNDSEKTP